jgi:hypothetical protein
MACATTPAVKAADVLAATYAVAIIVYWLSRRIGWWRGHDAGKLLALQHHLFRSRLCARTAVSMMWTERRRFGA